MGFLIIRIKLSLTIVRACFMITTDSAQLKICNDSSGCA